LALAFSLAGSESPYLVSDGLWENHRSKKRRELMMFGAHVIVYSKDAEADRAFFREVLGFSSVDAGHGWLIFALPPAEVAVHPAEENERHELYFMCDDLKAEIAALGEKGARCSEVQEARWGSIAKIRLPGGGEVGLYQPKHPIALARS
jgi:catechol 2,3-dioxygenase-like lactoylglutathione lyase family enzyme